jgi:hypothetical protein
VWKCPSDSDLKPAPRYADSGRECMQLIRVPVGIFEMTPAATGVTSTRFDLLGTVLSDRIYRDHRDVHLIWTCPSPVRTPTRRLA